MPIFQGTIPVRTMVNFKSVNRGFVMGWLVCRDFSDAGLEIKADLAGQALCVSESTA